MKNRFLLFVLVASCFVPGCSSEKKEQKTITHLQKLAVLRVRSTALAGKKNGTDRVFIRAQGEACLSVDLDKVSYEPETLAYTDGKLNDGQKLTLSLPLPRPENVRIIEDTKKRFGENRGFWTSVDTYEKEVADLVETELERQIRSAAEDPELVKAAKRQAEVLIKSFYGKTHPGVAIVIRWIKNDTIGEKT